VLRSFKESAHLTRGATGRLAATLVGLFVFNLLGAALLGVVLFVTVPISVLMMASIDRQLSATAPIVDVGLSNSDIG
jgi:maltodextrin utilization protein YvdJ